MLRFPAAAAEHTSAIPAADQFIVGKDKRLIVHSVKTGELETPLPLLREHPITPKEYLFVRNNQVLPGTLTLEAVNADNWEIALSGLIDKPAIVTVGQLNKLPQVEQELVLQCSGNGRAWFAKSVKAEGAQWQNGAMGNVIFRGVPLKAVLEQTGVTIKEGARFITAEGKDSPAKDGDDFEHSIPLEVALQRSMLALALNGEPIPKVHGGPVRLVTPGFYGTMNVKWVTALRYEAAESRNHHHEGRYRTPVTRLAPGTPFTSTLGNSEPNWDMRIKSVIFTPLAGDRSSSGELDVQGVAWNDGQTKIQAVEISTDGGCNWQQAELIWPKSAYAWHPWRLKVHLKAGVHTIHSRAIDIAGRGQPFDGSVAWNPAGYAWNGAESVTIEVT